MRILFVNHNSYTDEITGAEKSLYYDICCLLERGYDAAVLSRKQGKSTEFFRSLDVPVYICPYDSPALKKIITKVNPALVYINTIGPVRVGEVARSLGFPVLWLIREIPWSSVERVAKIERYATTMVAISNAVERNLRKLGVTRRIDKLPNAVDIDELDEKVWPMRRAARRTQRKLTEKHVVIGFVGKVSEKKGIKDFVKMAIRVGCRKPKAIFFIFGHIRSHTKPLIQQLKRRIALAKMSKRLFFFGFQQDVQRIYPALDIVVVPSLADEPFGRVTVEAMTFRKPVVAYDSGASRELVVHGETGFIVPKGDVNKLSQAVLKLLEPSLREQFGAAGRERVENHFSMPSHGQELVKLVNRYARPADTNREKVEIVKRPPTVAMLTKHCYPDVPSSEVKLRDVERLNVKPGASVVWRVELQLQGERQTLFLKNCYGKRSGLQTRLYKHPPKQLKTFQPTVKAVWPDGSTGGNWLAMEPLRRLPPYGGYKGREGVIRRLADMQGRFFFARFSDVERSGLTWIPDFLQRVHAASARGALRKEFERHRRFLPRGEGWSERISMALKGVPKLIAKIKNGPRALAHGDVHRGNLGLGDSGSIRLIDWSRCTVAPLPYDLVYLVERALARYPDYQLHQREFRQWAMSTYLAQLAKYKHKVSRKEFIRQYEITYLLHILSSSLWKRLRLMADGSGLAEQTAHYQLAKLKEWGKKYGVVK